MPRRYALPVEAILLKTALLVPGDDIIEVAQAALDVADVVPRPDDVLVICETPLAITQGRIVRLDDMRISRAARILNWFMHVDSSIGTVYGMQAAIDLAGFWRIFLSMLAAAPLRMVGRRGDFYRLAGRQVAWMDDVTGTMPPYTQDIVLGPDDPAGVAPVDGPCPRLWGGGGRRQRLRQLRDHGRLAWHRRGHGGPGHAPEPPGQRRRADPTGAGAAVTAATKVPVALAAAAGGAALGLKTFTWWRGDCRMVWLSEVLGEVDRVAGTLTGVIGIQNRGRSLGVVRRVEGHIVSGASGAVLATLQGSRPPERGWWVSNLLQPGMSCVAEIDLLLEAEPTGPIEIELTLQEMGRRVFQYRTARVHVPLPAAVPVGGP